MTLFILSLLAVSPPNPLKENLFVALRKCSVFTGDGGVFENIEYNGCLRGD
jgi:hypothetical protein